MLTHMGFRLRVNDEPRIRRISASSRDVEYDTRYFLERLTFLLTSPFMTP